MVLPSMHCSTKLIVTIVEIHMLVLDVCLCLNSSVIKYVYTLHCFDLKFIQYDF